MAEEIPLTEEDRAILDLEGPAVAGHTMKVIRLGAPGIETGDLSAAIEERIGSAPELTRKLGGQPGAPFWMPDSDFNLEHHITLHGNGERISDDEIRRATAALFAEHLDRDLPLWRIDVAPTTDGGTALLWRIHHVMADGSTAMRLARQVLWDDQSPGSDVAARTPAATTTTPAPKDSKADHERRRLHILGLFEREFARSASPSPFDGEIGHDRAVSFATVSLRALHDSAKSLAGATLNDAVLEVVTGALRHWMELHHEIEADSLRVKVPVSLHQGNDGVANRDSFFSVPLPLGRPDPVERLKDITEATAERKAKHDAEELDVLLKKVAHRSDRLGHLLKRVESSPRRFALNVSNVKGPRSEVSVLGAPVETVHSIVEIGAHHALRIAVLSVGDRLCFGFCADPELVADLDEMAGGAEEEAELLNHLASSRD